MITVGLTGNVAAGKSAVAEAWAQAGIPVLSADRLAREVVAPGTEGLREVVEAFGPAVLDEAGGMDRAYVRDLVFRDSSARHRLEGIIHPRVARERDRWVRTQTDEGMPLVVLEIPLLFEIGAQDQVDRVVLVDAAEDVRLERLRRDRELSGDEARRMMASQMDPGRKRAGADHVIENDGDLEALRVSAAEVLGRLLPEESAPPFEEPEPGRAPPPDSIRVDLHLHTRGSWDCLSEPEALLARARTRGVTRLAMTDHNSLSLALEMAQRHPDTVIPGEEVRTAEGIDVIGLYLREEIPRGTPAREVIRRVREQGGIAYLPHPYASGKGGGGRFAEELAPLVDVVEVFNGRLHPGRLNGPAQALARRFGRLRGAGSDAHTVGEVAGSYVEVPDHANTADALRKALLLGRPAGRTSSSLVHLASTWAKVRKRLPGA
ncbi:MAG: dephospho-CoA kinase [Gemmatimonadales bacterium]|nr:MAG: dephospho-CoA kinase [Gemmatimonadales bacterium]